MTSVRIPDLILGQKQDLILIQVKKYCRLYRSYNAPNLETNAEVDFDDVIETYLKSAYLMIIGCNWAARKLLVNPS